MKTMMMSLILVAMCNVAQAGQASLKAMGFQGIAGRSKQVYLGVNKDGQFVLASDGEREVIEPKVIEESRSEDGNLEIDLGKGRTLIVTSGFSLEGVAYYLKTPTEMIKLNPQVHLQIK